MSENSKGTWSGNGPQQSSAALPQQRRMIVAFALFVALLALVSGVLLWKSGVWGGSQLSEADVANSTHEVKGPNAIFYDRIGAGAMGNAGQVQGSVSKNSFTLEIKVTSSRSEAENLIDSLHADGIQAYYTPMTRSGRVVYRVRRGIFTDPTVAEAAAVALKDSHGVASKVTKLQ